MEISNKTIVRLYREVLIKFEKELKFEKTGYDIKNKKLQFFIKEMNLTLTPVNSKAIIIKQSLGNKNIIYFKYSGSQPHELLRHFRNIVAHTKIEKNKIGKFNFLIFEDLNEKKKDITMYGQIQENKLFDFIERLIQAKR